MRFPFLIYFSNKIRKVNVNWLILGNYENSWQGGTDERSSLRFIKKVFWTLYNSQFWPWKATSKKASTLSSTRRNMHGMSMRKNEMSKKGFQPPPPHAQCLIITKKGLSLQHQWDILQWFSKTVTSRIELRLVCWLLLKGWLDFLVAFSTCFW